MPAAQVRRQEGEGRHCELQAHLSNSAEGYRWPGGGRRSFGVNVWGSPGWWANTGKAGQSNSGMPPSRASGKRSRPRLVAKKLKSCFSISLLIFRRRH